MSYIPQIQNKISTLNSVTLTNVSGGTVWYGTGEEVSKYGRAGISVWTPFGESCTGTLTIEVSRDGVNYGGPNRDFLDTSVAEPHMWNIVEKYFRLKYTHGSTSASTLVIQTQYSVNADILLGHQLDETLESNNTAIITRSLSVGQEPDGSFVNQRVDGVGFQTTDDLASGATYNSAILSTDGYTQLQTHIVSSNNGTLGFKFCSIPNCSGTTVGQNGVERYVSLAYTSSQGFQLYSAPVFTPYVQYSFTNNGTGTTTQLFYETKLLTKALSGQLLGLNASIASSMVANLGRNVIVGQEPDGSFQNERKDGEAFKTTTLLGAGSAYTSNLISTHGYTQIETRIYSDQEGTLVGRWYSDANKTQLIRTFTRPYINGEVGSSSYLSSPVFGDYLEYTYTNGSTPQTQFNLELHLATKAISGQILGVNDFIPTSVVANLGRNVLVGQDNAGNFRNTGVDSEGHIKVHIDEPLAAFGELRTVEVTPVVQITHPYGLNYDLISSGGTGSGSLTFDSGNTMVQINSGGASSSSALLKTNTPIKYRNGQGLLIRFTAIFDTPKSGNTQWAGWGDSEDGFFIGYSGTSFGVMRRQKSVDYFTPQTEWNIDHFDGASDLNNPSGELLVPQNGNVYEMQVQWLGFGAIRFNIESNESGQFEPAHTIKYANQNTIPSIINPSFPIIFESKNTTNTSNVVIKNASLAGFVEGKVEYTGRNYSYRRATNPGTGPTNIFTIQNPSTINGKTNRSRILLKTISAIADGTQSVSYQIIKNGTITGASYSKPFTYTLANIDIAGTYTASSGRVIYSVELNKVSNVTQNLKELELFINPGEIVSIIGSGSNASAAIAISWLDDM